MMTSPANSEVEAILLSVQKSYHELNQLIDGPLARLDPEKLYKPPVEDEWSIMQNLAHTVEFMPYWANEIEKLVAMPGQNFGRTAKQEARLQAIREHGSDNLAQIRAALPGSYARLEEVLGNLKDSDLKLTAHHVTYSEKSLGWFIEEFVTRHLTSHLEQIKMCLAAVE